MLTSKIVRGRSPPLEFQLPLIPTTEKQQRPHLPHFALDDGIHVGTGRAPEIVGKVLLVL